MAFICRSSAVHTVNFANNEQMTGKPSWMPCASADALQARADLLNRVRDFFQARHVQEVETPVLSAAGNSDPGISQFSTSHHSLWLRTSPEYAMKRLLAAGSGDIYELGRVFRSEESGRHHNREFTILEWYRCGWSYHQLMDEVCDMVRHCIPDVTFRESKVSYGELFCACTGLDPATASSQELSKFVRSSGLTVPEMSRTQMLDLVISHFVQPELPEDGLTIVYDYPADQAALARIRHDKPPVAERFEVYAGKVELANGYQELTDAGEQRMRFKHENRVRIRNGEAEIPIDENLISALESGMPECAGVALGFDRLLMKAIGAESLADVMAFPNRTA